MKNNSKKALRGAALTITQDPFFNPIHDCYKYHTDALILIENGKISAFGEFEKLKDLLDSEVQLTTFKDSLILPGFIDTHVHYPQTQMMGAFGEQLIDWLNKYTFPTEKSFENISHAEKVADVFLNECLRSGTTTAAVYCTVHPESVDAFMKASQARGMRMIAGKVLMDRNAPDYLQDTAQSAYDQSQMLIKKWHKKDRLMYAITPRFAPTSTEEQLELVGALWKKHPDVYMQTHVSENKNEILWVQDLFPKAKNYLDVYAQYQLLGPRAILGHGIYLSDDELKICSESGTAIAHCPSSNLFLGSGLFEFSRAKLKQYPVRVGLATDVGAGTSFSMMKTMGDAYKVSQLANYSLAAIQSLYLATRGAAESLYLEDKIGSLEVGMEADLQVLDLKSTPLIDFRMNYTNSIEDVLFTQMTLADDRATRAVYVQGELVYERSPF